MTNFLETLVNILKADERFFTEDGTLLRIREYEASMVMDSALIKLLMDNDETKKRFIIELLDMNMLYVNLSDIDDTDYAISEADKAFTRFFTKRRVDDGISL